MFILLVSGVSLPLSAMSPEQHLTDKGRPPFDFFYMTKSNSSQDPKKRARKRPFAPTGLRKKSTKKRAACKCKQIQVTGFYLVNTELETLECKTWPSSTSVG